MGLFSRRLQEAARAESVRRARAAEALRIKSEQEAELKRPRALDLESRTFPEQLAYITDPSDLACLLGGRRSGKTVSNRILAAHTAVQRPGTLTAIVGITREWTKRLYWLQLQRLLRDYGIPFEHNDTELILRLYNESEIWLCGAHTAAEIEKLRGPSFVLVIIDEAGSVRERVIRPLVDDVLQWGAIDEHGKLRLTGTPPPIPDGYFVEAYTGKDAEGNVVGGWNPHHWDLFKNTKLPRDPRPFIERICKARGWTPDHPGFQREVLGRLVYDRKALVLSAFDREENTWRGDLPGGEWSFVICLDIGWTSADAMGVLGWSDQSPDIFLVKEHVEAHQTEEQLGAVLREALDDFPGVVSVVADAGGGGKKTVEGLAARVSYPIKAAYKAGVVAQFGRLNDEFRAKRLRVPMGGYAASDAIRMRWVPGQVGRKVDDEAFHSDILYALAYGIAEARHFWYEPPAPEDKEPSEAQRWRKRIDSLDGK